MWNNLKFSKQTEKYRIPQESVRRLVEQVEKPENKWYIYVVNYEITNFRNFSAKKVNLLLIFQVIISTNVISKFDATLILKMNRI